MTSAFSCRNAEEDLLLKPNTALVEIFATAGSQLSILRDECRNCSWTTMCKLLEHTKVLFNTTSASRFRIVNGKGDVAEGYYDFGNQGRYSINCTRNSTTVTQLEQPENTIYGIILPTIFAVLLLLIERRMIATWHNKISRGWARCKTNLMNEDEYYYPAIDRRYSTYSREESVDAARGFFILLMIFVNYGGGSFQVFEHASWYGFTVADAVFPGFIFISGVSYGLHVLQSDNLSTSSTGRMFWRLFKMCIYGLILNRSQSFETCRLGGVLQRIAAVLFIFHLLRIFIYLVIGKLTLNEDGHSAVYNVSNYHWKEFLAVGSLVGLFTLLFIYVPYTNCPPNYYGPGGISDGGAYTQCFGGFAKLLDETVLGAKHLYERPTCRNPYSCPGNFDPEGLFGTIMALINVFTGYTIGVLYRQSAKHSARRHVVFLATMVVSLTIGLALHFLNINPIVKNLWTPSYALVGNAAASFVLYLLFLLINKWKIMKFDIFQTCGVHALEIYIFHVMIKGLFPFNWETSPTTIAQTSMALWGTVCCILIAWCLEANEFESNSYGPFRRGQEDDEEDNQGFLEE